MSPPDSPLIRDKKVRVKLTGDGTNIGKHLHVVNFAFTILDEGDLAYSSAGNHCIAIFKEPEKYDSLKLCLRDIIHDIQDLNRIKVGDIEYDIVYFSVVTGNFWRQLLELIQLRPHMHAFGANILPWNDTIHLKRGQSVTSSFEPGQLKKT